MALIRFSFSISLLLLSLAFVVASANGYNGYKPESANGFNGYIPQLPKLEKPNIVNKLHPKIIAIQGLIYCKSGAKVVPLQGAVSRITCQGVDQNGYTTAPFSILSHPTDAKGYYFSTMSLSELEDTWKLKECKAFLESSPCETCKVPTDVNNGISGAPLSYSTFLKDKYLNLYSAKPFYYTSEPKPVSKGY